MEMSQNLKSIIEKNIKNLSVAKYRQISNSITEKYMSNDKNGKRLVTTTDEASVYSVVRMPATYGSVLAVLESVDEVTDAFNIKSVTDVGAGTGAASLACYDFFDELDSISCLEREVAMSEIGKNIMKEYIVADTAYSWMSFDILNGNIDKSDLVIESYMLNELPDNDFEVAVLKLWDACDKLLILVEPGTKQGFDKIQQARKILLKAGGYIVAPCCFDGPCNIADEDWCHFSVRVSRSSLHKLIKQADVPYEDEKYSYIVVSRDAVDKKGARILRHPEVASGYIEMTVCDETGVHKTRLSKKDGQTYKNAKKKQNGGLLFL